MTEPKRWSSSSSEVDPVLRSVLRYAQDLQPDSRQLQAILRGSTRSRPSGKRRRLVAFIVASGVAACAGIAWAGYASGLLFSSTPPPTPSAVPSAPTPAPRSTPRGAVAARDPAEPRVEGAEPRVEGAEPRVEGAESRAQGAIPRLETKPHVASAPSVTPSASPEEDATLLQQARLIVATDPARALTLTRDHERHFPTSPLSEERQALRIEALARLGRHPEASRALSTFDQTFPRSIYRHRLHALLPN